VGVHQSPCPATQVEVAWVVALAAGTDSFLTHFIQQSEGQVLGDPQAPVPPGIFCLMTIPQDCLNGVSDDHHQHRDDEVGKNRPPSRQSSFHHKKTPENLELSDILLIFATSNIFWRKYINVEP